MGVDHGAPCHVAESAPSTRSCSGWPGARADSGLDTPPAAPSIRRGSVRSSSSRGPAHRRSVRAGARTRRSVGGTRAPLRRHAGRIWATACRAEGGWTSARVRGLRVPAHHIEHLVVARPLRCQIALAEWEGTRPVHRVESAAGRAQPRVRDVESTDRQCVRVGGHERHQAEAPRHDTFGDFSEVFPDPIP